MNPLTNTKNLQKLNQKEIELGLSGTSSSWHNAYKDSAWIFVGGLPYDLTEGDIITMFSQYGEIVNINMVRDKVTGKQKGYAFICYEDQRSTVLAVDNLNATKILNRTIRVDHVMSYRVPEIKGDEDEVTKIIRLEGCGPDLRIEKVTKKLKKKEKEKKEEDKDEKDKKWKRNDSLEREAEVKPEVKPEKDSEAEGPSGSRRKKPSNEASKENGHDNRGHGEEEESLPEQSRIREREKPNSRANRVRHDSPGSDDGKNEFRRTRAEARVLQEDEMEDNYKASWIDKKKPSGFTSSKDSTTHERDEARDKRRGEREKSGHKNDDAKRHVGCHGEGIREATEHEKQGDDVDPRRDRNHPDERSRRKQLYDEDSPRGRRHNKLTRKMCNIEEGPRNPRRDDDDRLLKKKIHESDDDDSLKRRRRDSDDDESRKRHNIDSETSRKRRHNGEDESSSRLWRSNEDDDSRKPSRHQGSDSRYNESHGSSRYGRDQEGRRRDHEDHRRDRSPQRSRRARS